MINNFINNKVVKVYYFINNKVVNQLYYAWMLHCFFNIQQITDCFIRAFKILSPSFVMSIII